MIDSLIFRRAAPADAPALAALMADPAVFAGLLQMPYPSADLWRKRLEQQVDDPLRLHLLAFDGERAVASAGLHPQGLSARQRHVGGVGMCVAADWQGKGLGTEMLRRVLDYADRWAGYLRVELQVYTDNERAFALYRKMGFELEGTLRGNALRDGRYVDSHIMARLRPPLGALQ